MASAGRHRLHGSTSSGPWWTVKVHEAPVDDARGSVERVWREDGPRLWRSLVAFGGDPELASDAMAEAFAQALGRGSAIESADRWIWRAAFRIAAGELKERRRAASGVEPEVLVHLPEPIVDLVRALRTLSPAAIVVVASACTSGSPGAAGGLPVRLTCACRA